MPGWTGRRLAAEIEGGCVVFVIGMRVNKPWKVWTWLPVFLAMPRMLRELAQQQYAYACNRDGAHLSTWVAFSRRTAGSDDVGVWHETYLVRR